MEHRAGQTRSISPEIYIEWRRPSTNKYRDIQQVNTWLFLCQRYQNKVCDRESTGKRRQVGWYRLVCSGNREKSSVTEEQRAGGERKESEAESEVLQEAALGRSGENGLPGGRVPP